MDARYSDYVYTRPDTQSNDMLYLVAFIAIVF